MIYLHHSITVVLFAALAQVPTANADGTAAAQYKSGILAVDVSGPDVSMQLRLPMTRAKTF